MTMRFLLTPVGSSGDMHPFAGLARALGTRGHEVIILGAEPHRATAERSGSRFVSTFTAAEYHEATHDPDLWHPRRGLRKIMAMSAQGLDRSWQAIEEHYLSGRTVLVGHPLAFATRAFEEKTGAAAATIHLAPSSLRSAHQVPALPSGVDISGLPRWFKRALWRAVDRIGIDPLILPALNRFRAGHGLPPVHRIFKDWINSPRCTVGLFPEWFGPRQPDWPGHFHHASFPLWDDPESAPMDHALTQFLAAGSPPIVFTPGTANRQAGAFFGAAAEAITRLGQRALFLTGYPEQLPTGLPDTIVHRDYAPLSAVLPRSAALVHHGGIGTLAQGFAAGVPQLMMPMGFDQPDNALRATRLGVARWLAPNRFTAARVAGSLDALLRDERVRRAAAEHRDRVRSANGIGMACEVLERVALG
ncbi:MAG: glycosyltransferase [Gemmatimonadales bacterium]